MKSGTKVEITKLQAVENPDVETAKKDEYIPGQPNDKSPPVHYWLTGQLISDIRVGTGINVFRYTRNGKPISGYFQTSNVVSITEQSKSMFTVNTKNSVYQVKLI